MYKHYLPFYYLIKSRLKSNIDRLSWVIIFIIPPFLIAWYFADIEIYQVITIFVLGFIAFYSLYEIGYLENDIQTTKKEKKPTIRVDIEDQQFLEKNYFSVVLSRLLTIAISLSLLYVLVDQKENLYIFMIALFISRVLFFLHNTLRSRFNILTFFGLAITKYIAILSLVVPLDELFFPIILSILVFPLLRTIEHSSRKKYNLPRYSKVIGNHDILRVRYYILFSIVMAVFYYIFEQNNQYLLSLLIFLYFLCFRFISYLLVKNKMYERDRLKKRDIIQ